MEETEALWDHPFAKNKTTYNIADFTSLKATHKKNHLPIFDNFFEYRYLFWNIRNWRRRQWELVPPSKTCLLWSFDELKSVVGLNLGSEGGAVVKNKLGNKPEAETGSPNTITINDGVKKRMGCEPF